MTQVERNKRLFILLDKLVAEGDYDSIELIKTFVDKDSEAIQKTFEIMTQNDTEKKKK